jgi:glycosyltransferase involved in cell wall biosynthesis
MKIFTDGSRFYGDQISRIENGFIILGHEITKHITEADLVYSNNPSPSRFQIIKDKKDGKLKKDCKIIFNVLDIPEWCFPNYDLNATYRELIEADHVTCISKYVQSQLYRYLRINSSIIYNPAKDINDSQRINGIKKFPQYKAMMVGRLRDPSKRVELGINSLIFAGFQESEVAIVGSESIGWGSYEGIVSDEKLNDLYNSVDYVVMTSLGEGLGLPACEGVLAGAIPVVCHDLTTFNEFFTYEFGNYPNPHSISFFLRKDRNSFDIKKLQSYIQEKLDKVNVSNRIIKIYERIQS